MILEDYYLDRIMEVGEKRGFQVDIFVSRSEDLSCELDGDSLDSFQEDRSFGIGVRVLKEGKVGFAYSTEEEVDVIYRAMENLVPDRYTSIPEPSKDMPDPKGIFHRKVLDVGEEDLLEDLNTMRDILKEGGITVTGGAVERSYLYNRVLNSKGLDVEEEFTYYSASISGIKEGETAYDYLTRTYRFKVEELGEYVKDLLSLPRGVKTPYSGKILLTPRVLNSLLAYTLLPSFSAENIQRNRSILRGKVGEQVMGEHITIVDDGTLDGGLYSSKVDGEGVPRRRTVLVERGILKGYLYDIKRANIEGKESTGNGVRDYNTLPTISPSNVIIDPVDKLENYSEYLQINGLIGCHTSNPITGDFSVEISNSYIVRDGERIPVRKGMFSGNIFQILKDAIPMDDVSQRGRLISPSLMIEGRIVV
ncbi:MAG TPA: TldD/PmbA family protein [Methanothermococcus okinawensis]|uniref:TldD/PmbA family protein n=1 Tax=Methanothermococcus okinawensis TaxID=155863 RepID=A0A832ZZD8_9EURY|nr:TldD/PmbA family protein [Methanothermococcus okinawensis]